MIPAKRLAEIRQVGWDPTYAELLELVTAYEAARALVWSGGHEDYRDAYAELRNLFKPEPTK